MSKALFFTLFMQLSIMLFLQYLCYPSMDFHQTSCHCAFWDKEELVKVFRVKGHSRWRRLSQQRRGLHKQGPGSCSVPTRSCKFSTEEIMGAQKFNFARAKFSQNGYLQPQILYVLKKICQQANIYWGNWPSPPPSLPLLWCHCIQCLEF